MTNKSTEGLQGDPKRQAVASLRGYAYQIWHSVHRWITLSPEEILYLEGAEDLDILGPEKAETIQVKDTKQSGSITLRSRDALEAIRHFWALQEQHPGVAIHFRFLTTAGRGHEQGTPFGAMAGLDYWDCCRRPSGDLAPLRAFFQSQESLPATLRTFIASADDVTLRSRLIACIEWDTGNDSKEYIEELVNTAVIYYGHHYHHLPPSESLKVVPHLLKIAWDVVCQVDSRRLTYVDFIQRFEEATTVRVSRQELILLRQLRASVGIGLGEALLASEISEMGSPSSLQAMDLSMSPPPLPDRIAQRESLVAALSRQVKIYGLLILKGSTGMGKSTLAALMIHTESQGWMWVRLRGQGPEQIRALLSKTSLFHRQHSSEVKVVLDDLPFGTGTATYEDTLTGLLYAILSRGGQVIITTQDDLPSRVTSHFPMATVSSIEVPPLALDETKQLVTDYGCPSEDQRNAWALALWARTYGHPQLVHATVRKLEAVRWPLPYTDNTGEAENIDAVRQEARSMLQEQMPSPEAKVLAYRLSILGQPFRRDHALELGTHPPALTLPGEAFDQLVGPWIERVSATYYAISPLLVDAAKAIWASQDVTSLHHTAADMFLSCHPRTLLEASGALRHGLASGTVAPIFFTLSALENLPEEAWPEITRQFLWIVTVALWPEEKIFPAHPCISALLRRFQFLIATEIDNSLLTPLISAAWEREIAAIDLPEFELLMRLVFLVSTVIYTQASLDQRTIVLRTVEARRLVKERASLFDSNDLGDFDDLPMINASRQLICFAVVRCKSIDDFDAFLCALDEQPVEIRADLLHPFQEDDYWANLLCGKVWLNEAQSASPNWTRCIELFKRVVYLGGVWSVEPLGAAACHALAVIHDEYLDNPQAALATLEVGRAQCGPGQPVLENARAVVLYRRQQRKEALRIWEEVLPQWKSPRDVTPAYSYRKAEICAIEDQDWHKAATLALQGEEAASHAELAVMAMGFHADYAFALWKRNDIVASIAAFGIVLEALSKLPDPQSDLWCYTLYVRIDYGLTWILQELRGKHASSEPYPACFSDAEIGEHYKNYPIRSIVLLWNSLANIEFETKSENTIFKRLEEENNNSFMPIIGLLIEHLRIRHALRNVEMDSLIAYVSEFIKSSDEVHTAVMADKLKLKEGELHPELLITPDQPMKISLLIDVLFTALVILVNRGLQRDIPLEKWRTDVQQCGLHDSSLEDWFSFIAESPQRKLSQLRTVMCNSAETDKRMLAALFITASDVVNPDDRFYADILLVDRASSAVWRSEIEGAIGDLVSKGWARTASEQSFALQTPRINAPAILMACHDSMRGLKKAAGILLAAKNAVRLRIPKQMHTQLGHLAQD